MSRATQLRVPRVPSTVPLDEGQKPSLRFPNDHSLWEAIRGFSQLIEPFCACLEELDPCLRPLSVEEMRECRTQVLMRYCRSCAEEFAIVGPTGRPVLKYCDGGAGLCPSCGPLRLLARLRRTLERLPVRMMDVYLLVARNPSDGVSDAEYLTRLTRRVGEFRVRFGVLTGVAYRSLHASADGTRFVGRTLIGVPSGSGFPARSRGFDIRARGEMTAEGFLALAAHEHLRALQSLSSGAVLRACFVATFKHSAFRTFGSWRGPHHAGDLRQTSRGFSIIEHRCPSCGGGGHRSTPTAALAELEASPDGRKLRRSAIPAVGT